jgi:hypothetical protein
VRPRELSSRAERRVVVRSPLTGLRKLACVINIDDTEGVEDLSTAVGALIPPPAVTVPPSIRVRRVLIARDVNDRTTLMRNVAGPVAAIARTMLSISDLEGEKLRRIDADLDEFPIANMIAILLVPDPVLEVEIAVLNRRTREHLDSS